MCVDKDDEPLRANFKKMDLLKPVFKKNGTITAANASKINDGAAALLLMSRGKANELGLEIHANILGQSSSANDPEWFTTAPIGAIDKVLEKSSLKDQ